jgi:oligopeptide transport system substrate-binding protein
MRLLSAVLVIGLVMSLCGCGKSDHSPSQTDNDKLLRLNLGTEPPSLNPRLFHDSTSAIVLQMLFEGLTRLGRDNQPEPAIAEKIDISSDGKTYTFHLRPSKWSNGDPLTAHDFEYSLRMIFDPKQPVEYAYQLYMIKNSQQVKEGKLPLDQVGITALDDQTLQIQLEYPTPYFLEITSEAYLYPTHQKITGEHSEWASEAGPFYVSNGPFRLASWRHNNEIVLEKNPFYWEASDVKLETIRISMVEDVNTELSLFDDGELDWAGKPLTVSLPADAIPSLKKEGRLKMAPLCAIYMFVLNMKTPVLANVNFRRALSYAVNRQQIVDNISQTGEQPATSLVPPILGLQSDILFQDHNVPLARELFNKALQEMGLTLETLPPLTVSYNTAEGHHKIAQAIQQQWYEAFGFTVKLENLEWKVYLDKIRTCNFQIGRMGWVSTMTDPSGFLDLFREDASTMHCSGWHDPQYDALLNQTRETTDPEKRKELFRQAERMLIDNMPIIPLYFHTTTYVVNPRLQGVFVSNLGNVDFRWAYFE